MEKFLLIIMGPQGSGKGTQGKILAKKLNFPYAEMGPALQEYAQKNLEDKEIIDKFQAEGKLVPDEIVMRAIKYKFGGGSSIIFDGVPRNQNQTAEIAALAKEYDFKIVAVYIELTDKEALKRLLARVICPVDGHEPPYPESLKKKICDKCGAKLVKRSDDKVNVIKERLRQYHQKTEPILEYLEKFKACVIKIDGQPSVPEVEKEIKEELARIGIKNG